MGSATDFNTPANIKAIANLAALGMCDRDIAAALDMARATVLRIRQANTIAAGWGHNGPAPEVPAAPIADMVAAAQPKAQRPWSAKDV